MAYTLTAGSRSTSTSATSDQSTSTTTLPRALPLSRRSNAVFASGKACTESTCASFALFINSPIVSYIGLLGANMMQAYRFPAIVDRNGNHDGRESFKAPRNWRTACEG